VRPLQQSLVVEQPSFSATQQLLLKQISPPQHSVLAVQERPGPKQHLLFSPVPEHNPLQQSLAMVQLVPFGRHIGVVEVVLVDVEVVLVDVLVVLLVDVLVEVVVVLSPHGPGWSPWRTWLATALWETSMVFSSGVSGLWQMITFCC
jgi:hypothetical protein